jgi:hypothetical protein
MGELLWIVLAEAFTSMTEADRTSPSFSTSIAPHRGRALRDVHGRDRRFGRLVYAASIAQLATRRNQIAITSAQLAADAPLRTRQSSCPRRVLQKRRRVRPIPEDR